MLNGVSNVSFSAGVFDQPKIDAPQTFTRPSAPDSVDISTKKKGKGKKVLGALIGLAVLATGLALGNKYNVFQKGITKMTEGSAPKWIKSVSNGCLKYIDMAGEYVNKGAKWVAGLFGKKPAAAPEAPGVGTV